MKSLFLLLSIVSASISEPADLESRLQVLEVTLKKQEIENGELKEEVRSLKTDNRQILIQLALMSGATRGNRHVLTQRLLHQDSPIDGIGFYAYMSMDEPDPRGHHTLVYDVTLTNLGNGYNRNTGVFTAPRDGLYSFTWSTRVQCSLAHTTDLIINERIMGSTYAYCGYNTVTGHVVAIVNQGDVIFVRTHSTSPGQGAIKSNEFGQSAFSGFLIQ